jgi:hypothetical protein
VFSLYILKMFIIENHFEIKFCFYSYKNYRNRMRIDFRISFWKIVVLYEIYRELWKRPNTFVYCLYILLFSGNLIKYFPKPNWGRRGHDKSYGSWIYNYLCNRCLSPPMLLVRIPLRDLQHYVIKLVSDLRQVGGFLRVLLFSPPIKLTATI